MEQRKTISIHISGPSQVGKSVLAAWLAETLRVNGHEAELRDECGKMPPAGIDPLSPEGQQVRRGITVPYEALCALTDEYEKGLKDKAWTPAAVDISVSETSS